MGSGGAILQGKRHPIFFPEREKGGCHPLLVNSAQRVQKRKRRRRSKRRRRRRRRRRRKRKRRRRKGDFMSLSVPALFFS